MMTTTPDTAATYADFAHRMRYQALPSEVADVVKKLVLDELGVMVLGSRSAGVGQLLQAVRAWGGAAEAEVLVHGVRVPAHHAALVNGMMGRAYDYDALHEPAIVHASAGSLPQCLAVAQRRGKVSGQEFTTAMAVGMEFMIRLGMSFEESFLHRGRVTSVHHTTFGGALAAAKLLNLSPDAIVSTLALAFTQVGGNLQNVIEGTPLAQAQQGFAAQTSVLSAVLAASGMMGPRRIFQGEYGYYNTYHDGKYSPEPLSRGLGERYEVADMSVKYYPSCFLTHYANSAMIDLVTSAGLSASDIDTLHVRVTQGVQNLVCRPIEEKRAPNTTQEALFSLPYMLAVAATHGKVTLEYLTPQAIQNPQVRALAQKVTVAVDEELERRRGKALGSSTVEVRLKNGTQLSRHCDVVKGHPTNPMSFADCEKKFRECVAFSRVAIARSDVERLVDLVSRLERVADVSELCSCLRPAAA